LRYRWIENVPLRDGRDAMTVNWTCNLPAFAWHSVLNLIEPPWQAARAAAAKRTRFVTTMLTLAAFVVFPSWPVFLKSLATFEMPPNVLQNQKIPG
jgi:hypothetical protein